MVTLSLASGTRWPFQTAGSDQAPERTEVTARAAPGSRRAVAGAPAGTPLTPVAAVGAALGWSGPRTSDTTTPTPAARTASPRATRARRARCVGSVGNFSLATRASRSSINDRTKSPSAALGGQMHLDQDRK